jgi:hypothetical protein
VLVIPAVALLLLDSKRTPVVLLDSCSGCRKLSIPQALYCSWSRGSAELRFVKFSQATKVERVGSARYQKTRRRKGRGEFERRVGSP